MPSIFQYEISALIALLKKKGEPGFRAKQLIEWVYQKHVDRWSQMSNLPKALIERLEQEVSLQDLIRERVEMSQDGETEKFLWVLPDEKKVESVLIYSGDRRTVCVSSQVGCPARCAFCASGKKGLIRNLTAGEIVEQVVQIDRYLRKKGERVTHIVFMGMGEPLENYDAVVQAIRQLIHPEMMGLSQRRITLSTVGVVEKIYALSGEEFRVNLALSLHAPNQRIRQKIIPYARKYDLESVMSAVKHYAETTKRDITYEYTMIEGINDGIEQARELVHLVKATHGTVNLIPYNPVDGLTLQRPEKEKIIAFKEILERSQIPSTWRYTKGKDIAAACGQLALQPERLLSVLQ